MVTTTHAADEPLVLTNTGRWVIREMLSVARIDAHGGKFEYFAHKCEKNSMPLDEAKALAEAFELDVPDELWARYRPAV